MTYDVGIDVGTTFTAAAIYRGGAVEPVALTTSRVTVPSVVFADGDARGREGDRLHRTAPADRCGGERRADVDANVVRHGTLPTIPSRR